MLFFFISLFRSKKVFQPYFESFRLKRAILISLTSKVFKNSFVARKLLVDGRLSVTFSIDVFPYFFIRKGFNSYSTNFSGETFLLKKPLSMSSIVSFGF